MSLPAYSRSDSGPSPRRHGPALRPAARAAAPRDGAYPKRFGPYLLLRAFAQGGMGQVFLAKSGGLRGIDRLCVVKKLRSDHVSHDEYVRRFLDEARVVVQLNHANICHVFDVGQVGEEYYLAMEHVAGVTLRALFQRARKRGDALPPELVLRGALDVLEALDYAHLRCHPSSGQPLHLVHRDVSPQNIMWSYDGDIKLIDFGLAASELKEEHTQDHVVMGKVAYMSPEQARGERVTAHTDQFAAAIVLYELLTLERFYGTLPTHEIWQRAGRGDHVPERFATLPPELQQVLGRALRADPRDRFPSCGAFRDALAAMPMLQGGLRSRREVGDYVRGCFAAEYDEERNALAAFADAQTWPTNAGPSPEAAAPLATQEARALEATAPHPRADGNALEAEGTRRYPAKGQVHVWQGPDATSTAVLAERAFPGQQGRRRLARAVAIALTLTPLLVAGWFRLGTPAQGAAAAEALPDVTPDPASVRSATPATAMSPSAAAEGPHRATPEVPAVPGEGPGGATGPGSATGPGGAGGPVAAPRRSASRAATAEAPKTKAPALRALPPAPARATRQPPVPSESPVSPESPARPAAGEAGRGAALSDVVRVQDLPADRAADRERWRAGVVSRLQACPAKCARTLLHPASALVSGRPLDISERDFSAISFSVERCLAGCTP